MSNYIKNLISTQGWKEVEAIFDKAVLDMKNMPISENLPANEYKVVSIANIKAANAIKKVMKKIKLQGMDIKKEFKSYK